MAFDRNRQFSSAAAARNVNDNVNDNANNSNNINYLNAMAATDEQFQRILANSAHEAKLRASRRDAERLAEEKLLAEVIKESKKAEEDRLAAIERGKREADAKKAALAKEQAERERKLAEFYQKTRQDFYLAGLSLLDELAAQEKRAGLPDTAVKRHDAFGALFADKKRDPNEIITEMKQTIADLSPLIEAAREAAQCAKKPVYSFSNILRKRDTIENYRVFNSIDISSPRSSTTTPARGYRK